MVRRVIENSRSRRWLRGCVVVGGWLPGCGMAVQKVEKFVSETRTTVGVAAPIPSTVVKEEASGRVEGPRVRRNLTSAKKGWVDIMFNLHGRWVRAESKDKSVSGFFI